MGNDSKKGPKVEVQQSRKEYPKDEAFARLRAKYLNEDSLIDVGRYGNSRAPKGLKDVDGGFVDLGNERRMKELFSKVMPNYSHKKLKDYVWSVLKDRYMGRLNGNETVAYEAFSHDFKDNSKEARIHANVYHVEDPNTGKPRETFFMVIGTGHFLGYRDVHVVDFGEPNFASRYVNILKRVRGDEHDLKIVLHEAPEEVRSFLKSHRLIPKTHKQVIEDLKSKVLEIKAHSDSLLEKNARLNKVAESLQAQHRDTVNSLSDLKETHGAKNKEYEALQQELKAEKAKYARLQEEHKNVNAELAEAHNRMKNIANVLSAEIKGWGSKHAMRLRDAVKKHLPTHKLR